MTVKPVSCLHPPKCDNRSYAYPHGANGSTQRNIDRGVIAEAVLTAPLRAALAASGRLHGFLPDADIATKSIVLFVPVD